MPKIAEIEILCDSDSHWERLSVADNLRHDQWIKEAFMDDPERAASIFRQVMDGGYSYPAQCGGTHTVRLVR